MAYEAAITIKKAIENVQEKKYVLPSIQREFVWKTDQIKTLFDSLMRDYPIGTFLFWKVNKGKIKDFQFYDFISKYSQYPEANHMHNPKANLSDRRGITAMLDGQQRITSLYLGLTGTYAYKKPYARKNPEAYPERKLYLNLLNRSDELEAEYDFRFLTEEETLEPVEGFHWFPCSEIMNFKDINEVSTFLKKEKVINSSVYTKEQSEFAIKTLKAFFKVIHEKETISYYLEKGEELDKVLQIFIRINSGGTKLNHSDLLLSIATAQWNKKDARGVILKFVDDINKIGDGFTFNKDLVLKNCLVLADFPDIKYKVDNFNKHNMEKIEEDWEKTSSSLRAAIELVAKFGYSEENLIAKNAIIPIAYFICKNKCKDTILGGRKWESARKAIKEWLARVLLKGTFGGNPDSIYPGMRDLIKDHRGRFPLKEIIDFYKGKRKSISFSRDEIDTLLESQYGTAKTYCALTLIYPGLKHSFEYHQDHIHPKSKFYKRPMKEAGFSDEQIEQFNAKVNSIANLQLLEATDNKEKNAKPFKEWLNFTYPNKLGRYQYLQQHHIDPDQSLDFEDFMNFVSTRKETIKGLLIKTLNPTSEEIGEDEESEIE